jgi:lactoylglutathione lyase
MARDDFPAPQEGFVLTHFIVATDIARSRDFYVGGGPTDDKPEVVLEPPSDPNRVSSFLNLRVADIHAAYQQWSSRGAEFLTPPKDHGREIRCYMRDPDGHLIEVGQATGVLDLP